MEMDDMTALVVPAAPEAAAVVQDQSEQHSKTPC
jgi:hypothetical protein